MLTLLVFYQEETNKATQANNQNKKRNNNKTHTTVSCYRKAEKYFINKTSFFLQIFYLPKMQHQYRYAKIYQE